MTESSGKTRLTQLRRLLTAAYVFVFCRPSAQKFNDLLLHLTMRGRGYNLGPHPEKTGEAKFIRRFALTNPMLCVDIGANQGTYSRLLLEHTGAHVIAFEPLPKSFESLKEIEDAFPGRFTPVNVGVGERDETLTLNYGEASTLASFSSAVSEIDFVGSANVSSVDVPVVSLDSYFARSAHQYREVDLLKIDTEGFEFEVLSGARHTISELRPKFIQIEFNWHQLFRGHSMRDLSHLLPGYSLYQLLAHGTGLARRDWNTPEANFYSFSNFVFVRDDVVSSGIMNRG
ncbi:MAG: FkbM family methyltransferase [Mycobacterium sp.]|nr:FkbM family methyltransferase [Mycobacterium sp.]